MSSEGFELVEGGEGASDDLAQELAAIDAACREDAARQRLVADSRAVNASLASPKAKAAPKAAVRCAPAPRGAPRTVTGIHLVGASATGRRYYLLLGTSPAVASHWSRALQELGGTWTGRGRIPEGFGDLLSALNAAAAAGHNEIRVLW